MRFAFGPRLRKSLLGALRLALEGLWRIMRTIRWIGLRNSVAVRLTECRGVWFMELQLLAVRFWIDRRTLGAKTHNRRSRPEVRLGQPNPVCRATDPAFLCRSTFFEVRTSDGPFPQPIRATSPAGPHNVEMAVGAGLPIRASIPVQHRGMPSLPPLRCDRIPHKRTEGSGKTTGGRENSLSFPATVHIRKPWP